MLGIPEKYQFQKKFDVKNFLLPDLTQKEKSHFRNSVKEIVLKYQITGEEIPSLIDEEHNYQAILFFDVLLKDIKDSSFIGEIIQKVVKTLSVIRFYDVKGLNSYCFAYKRLNRQNSDEIVIEEIVYTPASLMFLQDEIEKLIEENIYYDNILNKLDKQTFYYEMLTKTMIIGNKNMWSGSKQALASKVYYNFDDMRKLVSLLKSGISIERNLKSEISTYEKARCNSQMRKILEDLNNLIICGGTKNGGEDIKENI